MKSKNDFTVRPSMAQDVQTRLPHDVALLGGQRLSGLTKALPHFLELSDLLLTLASVLCYDFSSCKWNGRDDDEALFFST
jgi:hypothetical protein